MPENEFTPPRPTLWDDAHQVVTALLELSSIRGGSQLFRALVTPPIEKRRDAWMETVGNALKDLSTRESIRLEDLQSSPEFVDAVSRATHSAMRTSNELKLESLRNAVINSARPGHPDENKRDFFLAIVDDFSPLHLRLLSLLDDPQGWYDGCGRKPRDVPFSKPIELVFHSFPESKDQAAIWERAGVDLYARGLTYLSSLSDLGSRYPYQNVVQNPKFVTLQGSYGMPGFGPVVYEDTEKIMRQWTTGLGREFLAFISAAE